MQREFPTLDNEGLFFLELEAMLTIKEKKIHFRKIKEHLIKWKNLLREYL
jgi:hypothetical protein